MRYLLGESMGGAVALLVHRKNPIMEVGGGANELSQGYSKGVGLGAEIIRTFVLVYTVFSATDPKRSAKACFDNSKPTEIKG
ncbi:hypothetical protein L3X38_031857 [Prunus dulcis]|uniref:Uncharacterized protein n=1 Tax=Prunus dulcis TaxID=3755 RepID=A0AAD4VCZ8_PRUDU|nr:hypothetical protein L3X38_031857 [Prunus dulcis]